MALLPRQGFHFRKSRPAESHVMLQAFGAANGYLVENENTLPALGDFNASPLYTETGNTTTVGRFSVAPDGCMVYTNGTDSLVWGGDEYRTAGFVVGDLVETVRYDYTSVVNNTLTDSNNVATIAPTSGGSADANTMLLLHCDGTDEGTTFTDSSPTTVHTMTARGNANTETSQKYFGTAAMELDGNGDYVDTPDDADFNFSGGAWTVDFWLRHTATAGDGTEGLYFHGTDADNYMAITMERASSQNSIKLSIYAAASEVVSLQTAAGTIVDATWYHVEISGNATTYYIFINGYIAAQTDDTDLPANYTGLVYIGCRFNTGAAADYFKGYIDEYRVSNSCRHTTNFTIQNAAYGATGVAYIFLGSVRPIAGFKAYIGTVNASASTMSVSNWYSGGWHGVSGLSDNTSSGGASLAQTGTVTWTRATPDTSRPRMYAGKYAYWYLVYISAVSAGTTVYYCTLNAPVQKIVDLWDGVERPIASALLWRQAANAYKERTTYLLKEDYLSADTLSFIDLSALSSNSFLLLGFEERCTGINIKMAPDHENTARKTLGVAYWDGDAWTAVTGLMDGTRQDSACLNISGYIMWDAPDSISEHKTSIEQSKNFYYYKVTWSGTLSASVKMDYAAGIPAPYDILGYDYCTFWNGRAVLVGENKEKRNSIYISSRDTVAVFNGEDSIKRSIGGDERVTSAAPLFGRFSSSIVESLVVFKESEVWVVEGDDMQELKQYKVADNYGCVAPGTLKSCSTGYEISPGIMKHILIWQSQGAICMFDGNTVMSISDDIANYFDRNKTEFIASGMMEKSEAFYDDTMNEYHWLFASASGTTLNYELVYDVVRKKWFRVDRGAGKYLQCGLLARDVYGQSYIYGGIDTGYLERLEYGNTMDGTAYISQFQTGDVALGGWMQQSKIRKVKHIAKAKSSDVNSTITITHYGDCLITASDPTATASLYNTTNEMVKKNESINWGNHVFHSIQCVNTISASDTIGYQPIGLSVIAETVREDIL